MHWQLSDYYGNSRKLDALETDLILFILECKGIFVTLLLDKTDHSFNTNLIWNML